MSFIATSLLFGAFAFAIPLAIHLLRKSQPQPVKWAAMHLLEFEHQSAKVRIRWRDWLLLALRCALPILLAVILARPVLTNWVGFIGDAPQRITLLVDDTASMHQRKEPSDDAGNQTKATDQVQRIIQILDGQHDVGVIPFSELAKSKNATTDLRAWDVVGRLLAWSSEQNDREQELKDQQLIILSDFRDAEWANENQIAEISKVATSSADLNRISLIPIDDFDAVDWVILDSHLQSSLPIFVNEPLWLEATLSLNPDNLSISRDEFQSVRVFVETDEGNQFEGLISLVDSGIASTRIAVRFQFHGQHRIRVFLADELPRKESAVDLVSHRESYHVIEVIEPQPVAVLNGDGPDERLRSEIFRLAIESGASEKNRFQVDAFSLESTIKGFGDLLTNYAAVLIVGWEKLTQQQATELEQFVSSGGHLILSYPRMETTTFPSISENPAPQSTSDFAAISNLAPIVPIALSKTGNEAPAETVDVEFLAHPAVSNLSQNGASELSSIRVRQWFESLPSESLVQKCQNVLKSQNGKPLIVQREIDQGLVTQLGIGADRRVSNIAGQAVFPVLLQQILLAQMMQKTKTSSTSFESRTGFFSNGKKLQWDDENGPVNSLSAVNLSAEEKTDLLKNGTPPQLTTLTETLDGINGSKLHYVDDIDAFQSSFVESQQGREIWHFGVILLVTLMFAEILLLRK